MQVTAGDSFSVHHQKIIHRDIKPSNLLLADDDHVKVSGATAADLVALSLSEFDLQSNDVLMEIQSSVLCERTGPDNPRRDSCTKISSHRLEMFHLSDRRLRCVGPVSRFRRAAHQHSRDTGLHGAGDDQGREGGISWQGTPNVCC